MSLLFWDIVLITAALYLAYMLRFDGRILEMYDNYFALKAAVFVVCFLISFKVFGLYNSLWNYASIDELISVLFGVTLGTALSGSVIYIINMNLADFNMPRSIPVLMWLINIIFTGGLRLGARIIRRLIKSTLPVSFKRVLIMGAGSAGSMVLKEVKENMQKLNYQPVGFIDDDPSKEKMTIHGLPVLGNRSNLKQVLIDNYIDEVIIAMPTAEKAVMRQVLQICKEVGTVVKTLPGVYEFLNGNIELNRIREVDIEDLLGRDAVSVDIDQIANYLNGETVLVTGAGGSIGSELCRQISRFHPRDLILLGRGENSIFEIHMELLLNNKDFNIVPVICDIKDTQAMENVFSLYRPTVVFHAAAHKHVPLMELNPEEAVKNNVFGTKNVIDLSDKYKVEHFVLISTDKAVNPTSIMGTTKRIAEIIMQVTARQSSTKYCAVRFGNVLGSRGSVVPIFKKQIASGGPVTVTHPEMTRYFMTISEAVQLVIQAGAMEQKGEIFVLDMGEPVKILDMAVDLIKLSGFEPYQDIAIEFTGVRDGEKLFEELLTKKERVASTKHERIFIADPDEVKLQKFKKEVIQKINFILEEEGSLREKLSNIING
ncbi:polysaccharide biosynthesis protein [Candidatus Contubernalis alkaliaceticus]|uniref:polysaccharide biosynthesis protein n=1 Tax=Candidatus Contubernalis alkaliaceticus TaxID=338645 RepID=UPI001F4C0390|nr:nucleoside-diphosphate sugar epimerase/dehydratase [Candidatus Contubernalis alkalaceticus]UNC93608.1 polysaccharide biosynthesis protein [Candidatus Contubernalis alkalaceticus]